MPLSEAVDAARMRKERSDHRRAEQDAFFVDAARKRKERSDHKRAVQDAEIPAADDSLPTRGRQRSSTSQSMVKAPGVASRSVKEDVAAHKRVTRSDHKRAVQDAEIPAADDSLPTRGRQRSSTPQSMVKAPGVASRSVKEDVAAHKRVTRSDHKRAVQDAEFASLEGPRRRSCLTRRFTANINTSLNGCDTWSRSR
jgi:hypothetical protein